MVATTSAMPATFIHCVTPPTRHDDDGSFRVDHQLD
jgi:hypothetical protein